MKKLRFIFHRVGVPLLSKITPSFLKSIRYSSLFLTLTPLLLLGALFFSFVVMPLQTGGNFARLVELRHDCGSGGYVEFELIGDPESYSYFWTHGPETLALDSLDPGEYTFVVQNNVGCVEEYPIEIYDMDTCVMTYQVIYSTLDPCIAVLHLSVTNGSGDPIDEEALDITWDDGNTSGLTREVFLANDDTYCVTISLTGNDSTCCYIDECITLMTPQGCNDDCYEYLIINETNKNLDGSAQFVELLVTGKCNCGDYTNLKGTILDDNDGSLIPAGELVNYFSLEQNIGANPGYLAFSYNENWDSVPNGSLIVIYDKRDSVLFNDLPADDPTDANQDGVYVLPIIDSLFFAKSGNWNENNRLLEYSGSLVNQEWELIKISDAADGIQIREVDGDYHHGISIGQTAYSAPNSFSLWLSSLSSTNKNIQLTGPDFLDKNDYTITDASLELRTPGLPNSTANAILIDSLDDCQTPPLANINKQGSLNQSSGKRSEAGDSIQMETILAYPNPFTKELTLEYVALSPGQANAKILSTSGQMLFKEILLSKAGNNLHNLEMPEGFPTGLLILEFTFPSGERKLLKIAHVQVH